MSHPLVVWSGLEDLGLSEASGRRTVQPDNVVGEWSLVSSYKPAEMYLKILYTSPHRQAGEPLIGCPRLLQYICSYPPCCRPFDHLQPEDAQCRGDSDPLNMGINKFYLCIDIKNINADDKNSIDNISTKYFLVDNRNVAFTRHSLPLLHNTSLIPLHPISSCHTTLYQRYSRLTTTLQCQANNLQSYKQCQLGV
jgi:hypothetical protein